MIRVAVLAAAAVVTGKPLESRRKDGSLQAQNGTLADGDLEQFRIRHSFPPARLKSDKWWQDFNALGIRAKSLGLRQLLQQQGGAARCRQDLHDRLLLQGLWYV